MTDAGDMKTIPSPIGESVPRVDALEKVTGEAIFTDDLQFGPGLLHGRVVRSPHPHALIKHVDVTKARSLPGVRAVVTGEECEEHIGLYLKDRYIFCRDRVRFVDRADAVDDDVPSAAREPQRDLTAKPARRPGDQSNRPLR